MMNVHADKIIANKFIGEFENTNNNEGISIGMIIPYSGNNEIPNGFLLCNGASVRKDTYIDLFNIIGTVYGSIDEEHFNLPNLNNRFLEGSNISGTYKEAGLPNITGKNTGFATDGLKATSMQGAFYSHSDGTQLSSGYNSTNKNFMGFDASLSNPIYGNSDTVQPNSLTIRYIIKAFNGINTNSTTDLEITQLSNEITDKANCDLNNLSENGRKMFFPSDTFVNVSPNWQPISSGFLANIVAPANGWYSVSTYANDNPSSHSVWANNINNHTLGVFSVTTPSQYMGGLWQVSKGQQITLGITANKGNTNTYFIYAEGEV